MDKIGTQISRTALKVCIEQLLPMLNKSLKTTKGWAILLHFRPTNFPISWTRTWPYTNLNIKYFTCSGSSIKGYSRFRADFKHDSDDKMVMGMEITWFDRYACIFANLQNIKRYWLTVKTVVPIWWGSFVWAQIFTPDPLPYFLIKRWPPNLPNFWCLVKPWTLPTRDSMIVGCRAYRLFVIFHIWISLR